MPESKAKSTSQKTKKHPHATQGRAAKVALTKPSIPASQESKRVQNDAISSSGVAQMDIEEMTRRISKLISGEPNSLPPLWDELNAYARSFIVAEVCICVGLLPDGQTWGPRAARGKLIIKECTKHLRHLERLHARQVKFEQVEISEFGRLTSLGNPLSSAGVMLSDLIEIETEWLRELLSNSRKTYNVKRLGGPRKWFNLVFAQDFTVHWAAFHNKELKLRPEHIADLIDFLHRVNGRDPRGSDSAENIRKAIKNFKKLQSNQVILGLLEQKLLTLD